MCFDFVLGVFRLCQECVEFRHVWVECVKCVSSVCQVCVECVRCVSSVYQVCVECVSSVVPSVSSGSSLSSVCQVC